MHYQYRADSQFEIAPVSKTIEKTLKERLTVYRDSLISETLEHATALIGINLCTGLTDRNISLMATNCLHVHSESDLLKFGITSRVFCASIFEIIKEVLSV